MKRLLYAAAALVCALAPALAGAQSAPSGFVTLTESALVNASGSPITNATACALINSAGVPLGARVTVGKTLVKSKVCANVVSGAYSLVLPDTNQTQPQHVCFALTITDNTTGRALLDNGYACLQPSSVTSNADSGYGWCTTTSGATTCNIDNFNPNQPNLIVAQYGPKGADGVSPTIAVGSVTTGTSAAVTNAGTSQAAVFNFTLPKGDKGDAGTPGTPGAAGAPGANSQTGTISANFKRQEYNTDGSTNTFTMPSAGAEQVYFRGVLLSSTDYSKSGTTITLGFTPAAGTATVAIVVFPAS